MAGERTRRAGSGCAVQRCHRPTGSRTSSVKSIRERSSTGTSPITRTARPRRRRAIPRGRGFAAAVIGGCRGAGRARRSRARSPARRGDGVSTPRRTPAGNSTPPSTCRPVDASAWSSSSSTTIPATRSPPGPRPVRPPRTRSRSSTRPWPPTACQSGCW